MVILRSCPSVFKNRVSRSIEKPSNRRGRSETAFRCVNRGNPPKPEVKLLSRARARVGNCPHGLRRPMVVKCRRGFKR
jgi:hypothetical protein